MLTLEHALRDAMSDSKRLKMRSRTSGGRVDSDLEFILVTKLFTEVNGEASVKENLKTVLLIDV